MPASSAGVSPVLYSSFQMEAMPISNAAELDSPEPRSTSLAV